MQVGHADGHPVTDTSRESPGRLPTSQVRSGRDRFQGRASVGSPRIQRTLAATDIRCSRKRIARLMRQHGLVARVRRRRGVTTTDRQHALPVVPNVLARQFTVDAPNRVWVADIT